MGVDVVIVVIVVVFVVELIETIIPIFILRATTFGFPIVAHESSLERMGVRSSGKAGGVRGEGGEERLGAKSSKRGTGGGMRLCGGGNGLVRTEGFDRAG